MGWGKGDYTYVLAPIRISQHLNENGYTFVRGCCLSCQATVNRLRSTSVTEYKNCIYLELHSIYITVCTFIISFINTVIHLYTFPFPS